MIGDPQFTNVKGEHHAESGYLDDTLKAKAGTQKTDTLITRPSPIATGVVFRDNRRSFHFR